jgi:molecular chaperone HscA
MGRGLKDVSHVETMPYDFVDAEGMVRLRTVQGVKSPVRCRPRSSRILRVRAERSLGGELTGAVITVPAYFDDAQRQATKDAAPGWRASTCCACSTSRLRLPLPMAWRTHRRALYAVYDLGGGTFDISILRLSRGVFEVVATNGDASLGGDDFDHRLFCWILDNAGISLPSDRDARRLLMKAREVKERLSLDESAPDPDDPDSGDEVDLASNARFSWISPVLWSPRPSDRSRRPCVTPGSNPVRCEGRGDGGRRNAHAPRAAGRWRIFWPDSADQP